MAQRKITGRPPSLDKSPPKRTHAYKRLMQRAFSRYTACGKCINFVTNAQLRKMLSSLHAR